MPALKCVESGECMYGGHALTVYGKDVVKMTSPVLVSSSTDGLYAVYNVADLEKKKRHLAGQEDPRPACKEKPTEAQWKVNYLNIYGDRCSIIITVPWNTKPFRIPSLAREQCPLWWKKGDYRKVTE